MTGTRQVRLALAGLGTVGRLFLQLLEERAGTLASHYGIRFSVHCIADSSGVAVSETGFEPGRIIEHKSGGLRVDTLPEYCARQTLEDALGRIGCNLLLEASPLDLDTGNPGLANCRAGLEHGLHVVLANKSPLALAHRKLAKLAEEAGVGMLYSATFCGGLPVLNVIRRDMVAGRVQRFRGVFNGTTNFILDEMLHGRDYEGALRQAQEVGAAEADPSLDVGGWDTAAKLVIAANSFAEPMITLGDVRVTGIENVQPSQLLQCREQGTALKLIANAERVDDAWQFRVEPVEEPSDSFLGSCNGWEMAVEIDSDIYGKSFYKLWEREPVPTAASMLRDAVHLATMGRSAAL